MADLRRGMEGRLLRAALWKRRGPVLLAVLAVAIATSVAAALMHLSDDVSRKVGRELRAFGPNLLLVPESSAIETHGALGRAPQRFLSEPVVRARLSSEGLDGALLLYLEDVGPNGRSRYLTEGGLRLLHREVDKNPGFEAFGPVHSFTREDARSLVPGEPAAVDSRLNPIAVRIARGHRLRWAIAGADAAIFERVPQEGTPTLTVDRNTMRSTYIELPVVAP